MAPAELGATGSRQALPTWATQAPVATIIEAIANAVKRPGGRARLLHADNRSGAWVSVAEAVQSGQAFFVEVADDVLAIDCDSADRVDVVQKIAADLQVHGYRPVQIASGRPDHQHLFVRVADSQARASFVERAKQADLDVRRSMRPPGSPHRLGLSVRFLDPADPAEALAALSRRARPPLSPGMEWMLRTGDFRGRYASRSEMLLGLAMAAVNAGWTFSEYVESILTSAAGEKLRGRTAQAAEKYLKRCWAKAVQRAVTTPPVRNRTDAQREIISIFEAAFKEVMTWSGAAGATDAKVLIGHLDLAFEVGSPTYHVSVRTLANRTVIPATTVARSHRRLIKRGWLSLICGAGDGGELGGQRSRWPWRTSCARWWMILRSSPARTRQTFSRLLTRPILVHFDGTAWRADIEARFAKKSQAGPMT